MRFNRTVLLSAATITMIGIGAAGATTIFAQSNTKTSFVAELAQKLGIDQSKVQTAVDQIKTEHTAQVEANFESKLSDLVTQGKLTVVQKQAVLDKMTELKSYISSDAFKNLTPQQKKQALQTKRTDLENWAKQEGIDLSLINPKFTHMFMGGKIMMRKWQNVSPTPQAQ
jgi:nucleoid DNA-binding protein